MPPNPPHKRKLPFSGLQRRVRARREDIEPEPEEYSTEEGSQDGDSDDMSEREERISGGESDSASGSQDDDEEADEEEEEGEDPSSSAMAKVSFGALARAQASMPSIRRKKGRKFANSQDEEDEEEEEEKEDERHASKPGPKSSIPSRPQRSSKHAPMEMSSKRQVSRKRQVVSVHKVAARDPRFSAASGPVDESRVRKAYAFLDEYRDSEMAQLKAAIKKAKSAPEREELARTLKSMQSRKETRAKRDAERELLAQHRRQEKERVAQGKKPFYLKKSEQKKQLLMERFAGMKKKQVDRTIERRRKKLTARERRNIPIARRGTTG